VTYPAGLLIHLANLETGETLGAADAYGVKATTKTYTQISCRFGFPKVTYPQGESGDRVVRDPSCIVPATTTVAAGKIIIGLTSPYAQTYRVQTVRPAMCGPVGSVVSHLVLELEAVT
jgi:hypothetical protein